MPHPPLISIIIPIRDRRLYLEATLSSLVRQKNVGARYEILIVDDNSTEDIKSCLDAFPSSKENNIRYLRIKRKSSLFHAGKIRNLGVKAAAGKLLLFLDSDNIPDPYLLSEHLSIHGRYRNAVALGYRFLLTKEQTFLARTLVRAGKIETMADQPLLLEEREVFHAEGKLKKSLPPWIFLHSHNFSLPRELFLKVGGFDEVFKGWGDEDVELGYRLFKRGALFYFNKNAICFHQAHGQNIQEMRLSQKENRAYFLNKHPSPETELWCSNQILNKKLRKELKKKRLPHVLFPQSKYETKEDAAGAPLFFLPLHKEKSADQCFENLAAEISSSLPVVYTNSIRRPHVFLKIDDPSGRLEQLKENYYKYPLNEEAIIIWRDFWLYWLHQQESFFICLLANHLQSLSSQDMKILGRYFDLTLFSPSQQKERIGGSPLPAERRREVLPFIARDFAPPPNKKGRRIFLAETSMTSEIPNLEEIIRAFAAAPGNDPGSELHLNFQITDKPSNLRKSRFPRWASYVRHQLDFNTARHIEKERLRKALETSIKELAQKHKGARNLHFHINKDILKKGRATGTFFLELSTSPELKIRALEAAYLGYSIVYSHQVKFLPLINQQNAFYLSEYDRLEDVFHKIGKGLLQPASGDIKDELIRSNQQLISLLKSTYRDYQTGKIGKDSFSFCRRAQAYLHKQNYPKAKQALFEALRINPQDAFARLLRGQLELELGNPQKALDILKLLTVANLPFFIDKGEIFFYLGKASLALGKKEPARKFFRILIKSPDFGQLARGYLSALEE